MDYLNFLPLLCFIWACIHVFTYYKLGRRKSLPPGPRPLPFIGNIFQLGDKPHQDLAKLSKTFGPLVTLELGSLTTIVVSSPDLAKETLIKHDQALFSRTIPENIRAYNHHNNSVVWLPSSTHWRNLRKIGATQMFTVQRLDASQEVRRKKVQQLLDFVHENCKKDQAIDIGQAAFTTTLNLMSSTFFSIDLAGYSSDISHEFNDLVVKIMEETGRPNLADYFPILSLVDPQGAYKRTKIYFERLLKLFDGIINDRIASGMTSKESQSHDVLESLLMLVKEGNSEISLLDIKHLLLDYFVAGTDTTARTLEWTMAELLHNPEKLAKAKGELKAFEGVVQEADLSKFPYLQAIVKETFRLHPPAPFLVPRKAESEVEISRFRIPKNAQILVNVWAMGTDASIWQNPYSFEPERFLDSKIDVKGRDFELIPFGAGRRICPGLPLAHRMVHLMLASLIHSFEWKLANGMKAKDMDMNETFGLTLRKTEPLLAVPHLH
ncbi:hypothetical protein P3X46_014683 [Hevea brasiliensis]|uniref:Cytochrome P450 n=1 Tax=Hevea brasiliensis TaxID=3981 RepID=A0ABQ9LWP5_HEVBR|nr:cytochrome P450 76T24-like [Hevea brasiliensis]KAJ9171295.1 hypothetical protein P3X46_014683 [Hevea brasiliensis]